MIEVTMIKILKITVMKVILTPIAKAGFSRELRKNRQ